MKKILTLLIVAVVSIGAFAQKGEMALGVDLQAVPCLESGADLTNFGIGAKWQYGLNDQFRLEADIDYLFKSKGVGQFDIIANLQYLFNIGGGVYMYPLFGVGYANMRAHTSFDKFLFNVGLGGEYKFTSNIKGFLEVKYQYVADYCKMPIALGVTFAF